jgi:hypothetical protein
LGAQVGIKPITLLTKASGKGTKKGETHKKLWEFHAHKKQLECQKGWTSRI